MQATHIDHQTASKLVKDQFPHEYYFAYQWSNYIVAFKKQYGVAARRNRGRHAGTTIHQLVVGYIVASVKQDASIEWCAPRLHSVSPSCSCTQGQLAGHVSADRTFADVNCKRCISRGI